MHDVTKNLRIQKRAFLHRIINFSSVKVLNYIYTIRPGCGMYSKFHQINYLNRRKLHDSCTLLSVDSPEIAKDSRRESSQLCFLRKREGRKHLGVRIAILTSIPQDLGL